MKILFTFLRIGIKGFDLFYNKNFTLMMRILLSLSSGYQDIDNRLQS